MRVPPPFHSSSLSGNSAPVPFIGDSCFRVPGCRLIGRAGRSKMQRRPSHPMASDGWSAYIPPCKCLQRTLNPQFRIKLLHRAWLSFPKDVEPQRLRPAGIAGQLWVTAVGTRSRKATRPHVLPCLHEWRGRRGRRGRWKGGRLAIKSRDTCIRVASRQPDQQLLVGPRTSRLDHSRVPILLMARPYADRNEDSLHRGSAPDPQSDPGAPRRMAFHQIHGWHS